MEESRFRPQGRLRSEVTSAARVLEAFTHLLSIVYRFDVISNLSVVDNGGMTISTARAEMTPPFDSLPQFGLVVRWNSLLSFIAQKLFDFSISYIKCPVGVLGKGRVFVDQTLKKHLLGPMQA